MKRMLVLLCFVFVPSLVLAEDHDHGVVGGFDQVIELHRKVLFLLSDLPEEPLARERDTFIARNLYVQKQHLLEAIEANILEHRRSILLVQLALIDQLEGIRAGDLLAVTDLVDSVLFHHTEAPFLNKRQLGLLRNLEQQISVVQNTYGEEIAELLSAMGTRGLPLEPWEEYLNHLKGLFDRDQLRAEFNQGSALLAEPATRGADPKKPKKDLIWGFGLPKKTVVLTFDDGPHYRNTGAILDTLKEYKVQGYFFAVGKNIGKVDGDKVELDKKSKWLTRALNEGHRLGNHSYSHKELTKLESVQQAKELKKTNSLLAALTGEENQEFRPPYGSKNKALIKLSSDQGMRSVMWNIDSMDWGDPQPKSIVKRVMAELEKKQRGIILFHDIHKQTVQALPLLLKQLKEDGYKVVTLEGKSFAAKTNAKKQKVDVAKKSEFYGNSWAFVVGINQYTYWPKLTYAVHDAQGISDILQRKFGFKKENIITLLDEKATRENITEVLADVLADPKKVKPNDRVFIFYAGHGMTRTLPSGRNLGYIIPVDAKLDKFHSKSISMTHLQDFSEMIPAKHVYFVMDSCYSGIALTRGVSQSKYLAEVSSRQARQILTAGGADQQVADGGFGGHSIFTGTLIQGLEGAADLDGNTIITASELGAYVTPTVSEQSDQTPAFGNLVGSQGGEFLFELASTQIETKPQSEVEQLRQELMALQKENANLKMQLANLLEAQVEQVTKTVIDLSPKQRSKQANKYHAEGLKLYRKKQYDLSLAQIRKALELNPTHPGIVNDYGFILYRNKQYGDALFWLEKTIELDAKRIPVYLNIADTLVALKKLQEAVPYYRYYLELYPESPVKERVEEFLKANSEATAA